MKPLTKILAIPVEAEFTYFLFKTRRNLFKFYIPTSLKVFGTLCFRNVMNVNKLLFYMYLFYN